MRARIYEDNAGNITIVTDDGRSIWTDRPNYSVLEQDLASLPDWIDDSRNDRPDDADQGDWDADETLIAERDNDGALTIYEDRMGANGRLYLYGVTSR
jgi:hypothetical protein